MSTNCTLNSHFKPRTTAVNAGRYQIMHLGELDLQPLYELLTRWLLSLTLTLVNYVSRVRGHTKVLEP